jgi:hypothetical protein
MNIETGGSMRKSKTQLAAKEVYFVAEDGNTMFEVRCGKDGRSIEVRGVECCKVGGVLYSECIDVRPVVSNRIIVRSREYDDTI